MVYREKLTRGSGALVQRARDAGKQKGDMEERHKAKNKSSHFMRGMEYYLSLIYS